MCAAVRLDPSTTLGMMGGVECTIRKDNSNSPSYEAPKVFRPKRVSAFFAHRRNLGAAALRMRLFAALRLLRVTKEFYAVSLLFCHSERSEESQPCYVVVLQKPHPSAFPNMERRPKGDGA